MEGWPGARAEALLGARRLARRVVLAQKVGTKRSFAAGLLLTIVTFGVYAVYWNYRAHNEVYRQFELARENRDEGMVWYVLGLVLPPFLLAYLWVMASNVAYVRERIGLRRSMTPGRLVTLVGLGAGAFALGVIILEAAFVAAGGDTESAQFQAAAESAGVVFLALAVVAAFLFALAYRGLQHDINELWDAYDARISYLRQHPESLAPPVAAPAPLRARLDALRLAHPRLVALPRIDELTRRAEAGETSAAQEAHALVEDVEAALAERAELLRRRHARDREAHELRMRLAAGEDEEASARMAQLVAEDEGARLAVLDAALYGS